MKHLAHHVCEPVFLALSSLGMAVAGSRTSRSARFWIGAAIIHLSITIARPESWSR
jgi:hypothetical protein